MIGNYKVSNVIGEGGFGKTYLAEHAILKKKVVIKQSLFKSEEAQNIILNEASLLWDVNYWALPTVKDVIINEDGDVLMIMTYIEGEELYKYIEENGPVDIETACWISQRILSALYYLHFAGIVHRDVKPANIIVDFKKHIASLVDFGLSKLKPDGSPDESGYTPYFASPEQIEGKPPIPESDIYSLGMTMIYIIGGDIRSNRLPDDLPPLLEDFIYSLVRQDPAKRPKNCKELNNQLGEIREKIFSRKHTFS
jgi:serine/threonine protein kinase